LRTMTGGCPANANAPASGNITPALTVGVFPLYVNAPFVGRRIVPWIRVGVFPLNEREPVPGVMRVDWLGCEPTIDRDPAAGVMNEVNPNSDNANAPTPGVIVVLAISFYANTKPLAVRNGK
jgi:hypothetical protein